MELKDIGLSQAAVKGSEAVVWERSKRDSSSSRRPSPQSYLERLSNSMWPREWTQCVPRTFVLLQQYSCEQQ